MEEAKKSKGVPTQQWKLQNYLNKHDIYKDNVPMQEIIINSFYSAHNEKKGRLNVNNDPWKDKLNYVNSHFGLFAMYAHNEWKQVKK